MNKKRIEVGDSVKVLLSNKDYVEGVVDYVPCATGDSWIILDQPSNVPVYIQNFDLMALLSKG